ncbi:hypothetical protein AXG93_1913s1130 [Marchantia polymorpha subsp. ruderalis]|uniref:Cytochrome P450 n=1 Tax=Marchantia polymorpha subsp. ruderalis TaxID=1480154 RepID=A0A176WL29_MARPO|nr:hypothetical protein AXG93_1913s1130 [Marchantia polymorpha subsp. ruderalis]
MQSMYLPGERIAVQAHLNYAPSSSCNVWKDMLTLPSDLSSSTTRWGRPPRPLQLTIVNVTPNSGESCPFSDTFISTEVINDGSSNAKEKQRKDTRFFVPAKPVWNSLMRTKTEANGPNAWPVVGTLPELWLNYDRMHDWLLEYFQKAGLTFATPMPTNTYVYTADPAVCEYILKTNFANYPKGELFQEVLNEFLGDGIFNSDGELWKKQRKLMQGEVQRKVLRDYSLVTYREKAHLLASIVSKASYSATSLEMQDLFKRMTLDTIVEVATGVQLGALSYELPDVPFQSAFDEANVNVHVRFVDPLWRVRRFLNIGIEARFKDAVQYMDTFLYDVIRTRRRDIAQAKSRSKSSQSTKHEIEGENTRPDLVSRYMFLDESTTDKSIRDDVLSFVMAGRDSTSSVLAWFIHCLLSKPEVAEKIFDELCAFEARHQPTPTLNSVHASEGEFNEHIQQFVDLLTFEEVTSTTSNFQYLHAAITETIRLYPVVPQDVKGVLEDDVLPSGHTVRKGDLVAFIPYAMGRLQDLWGPDAAEYRPERWLNEAGAFEGASPYKFTAFQAGPRSCLGKDAAYLQMKIVMAVLCRFFKFESVPGHQIGYRMSAILMMKDGMHITASRRA